MGVILPKYVGTDVLAGGVNSPLIRAMVIGGCLGVAIGVMFGALTRIFKAKLAPTRISAGLALGMIPILALAIPVYALARVMGI